MSEDAGVTGAAGPYAVCACYHVEVLALPAGRFPCYLRPWR